MLLFMAIVVSLVAALHHVMKNWKFLYLSFKLPSPVSVPFIGDALLMIKHKSNFVQALGLSTKRYGDCFALRANTLVVFISNPDDIEQLCTNPASLDRGPTFKGLEEVLGPDNILTIEGEKAKKYKKLFLKTFNGMSQEIVFHNFKLAAEKLMKHLETVEGKEIKSAKILKRATLDSILATAYDIRLDEFESFKEIIVGKSFFGEDLVAKRGVSPLHSNTFFYRRVLGAQKIFDLIAYLNSAMFQITNTQRRKELLDLQKSGGDIPNFYAFNLLREMPGITDDELYTDAITLIVTALDTSAVTAAYTLILLAMHPEYQQIAYEETVRVHEELNGEPLSDGAILKYKYMNLVIKEAMRIFPSIPIFPRLLRKDMQFGKHVLPKGATVVASVLSLHRDPTIYENPTVFNPDRFNSENIGKIPKNAYLPFGAGPRSCPGFRYGMQSATILVTSIIRKYKVFTPHKSIEDIDKNLSALVTLNDGGEFPIRLERR